MEEFKKTKREYLLEDFNEVATILTSKVEDDYVLDNYKKSLIFGVTKKKMRVLSRTLESMYYHQVDDYDVYVFYQELTKEGTSLLGQANKFIEMYKTNYLDGLNPYII